MTIWLRWRMTLYSPTHFSGNIQPIVAQRKLKISYHVSTMTQYSRKMPPKWKGNFVRWSNVLYMVIFTQDLSWSMANQQKWVYHSLCQRLGSTRSVKNTRARRASIERRRRESGETPPEAKDESSAWGARGFASQNRSPFYQEDANTQRTSHNFNENQPMHRKRNFLKIFCSQIRQKSHNVFFEPHSW